jgi:kynureninase
MPDETPTRTTYPATFEPSEAFAGHLDEQDPLRSYRDRFHLPRDGHGKPLIYFCSHSLGLEPKTVAPLMEEELKKSAGLGVKGHFEGESPWYTYQEGIRQPAADIVGAKPSEVIFMNGLTVNLHLMMATFYRPTPRRYKILVDEPTFPSDLYAVKSQLAYHSFDPADAFLTVKPRAGEPTIRAEDIESILRSQGEEIALVLFGGVNFLSGQRFDLQRITATAHQYGCAVGFDLAHSAGNVMLKLHDWDVDFAAWCNYKYLNCGPGAVAGCFVHERHGNNPSLVRLAGWWGNNPATRFRMQLDSDFVPQPGADGWQVSNPPILALVPIRASLAIYDEVGMGALRAKSVCLTNWLSYLLAQNRSGRFQIITPENPEERGCQLSLLIHERARQVLAVLEENGVVADFREPNILRVAPVPLYNTFHEVWQFASILAKVLG